MSAFLAQIDNILQLYKLHNHRPSWDEYFMSCALLASSRSPCERLQVGCVIVKDKRVISTGYNGYISGFGHNSIVRDNHEQATVHSEQNAITDAAKRGTSINNGTIYITHFPCINCFKSIISSGIKEIIYLQDYKNDDIVIQMIKENDIIIKKLIM